MILSIRVITLNINVLKQKSETVILSWLNNFITNF
jgi:hypothetical protein